MGRCPCGDQQFVSVSQCFNLFYFIFKLCFLFFEPKEILKLWLVLCGTLFLMKIGFLILHGFIFNPEGCLESLLLTDNYIL